MSNEDFEVHETGTGEKLNLVEALKKRNEDARPIIELVAAFDCDCIEMPISSLPDKCASCRAKELLKEWGESE